jgi:hypothetical protein
MDTVPLSFYIYGAVVTAIVGVVACRKSPKNYSTFKFEYTREQPTHVDALPTVINPTFTIENTRDNDDNTEDDADYAGDIGNTTSAWSQALSTKTSHA